ncbi:MAG: PQQ-binding-like beta-propeller repeat protein [Verrucomicrobiota bacterium]|nr:PQQ-binding-like beta-propeller repeat protein [Verrucomicrobiota bacterium]
MSFRQHGLGFLFMFMALAVAWEKTDADTPIHPWNQFRGPNGSGVATGCQPPLKPEDSHQAWKTAIPPGLSSPVISKGKLFLTAIENNRLVTLAYESKSGKLLWQREAPEVPLEKVHKTSSPATSTPLVDTKHVYVYFGSFGMICYDHEGREKWKKTIPTPGSLYGMSTSPIAYKDTVILVIDNDKNLPRSRLSQSKIVAFHKDTGKVVWETGRPHHRSGWSTPIIWNQGAGKELVVLGNGNVRGYNPDTGAEKWFVGGFSRETIAVPVSGNGHVYISSAQLGGVADEKIDPKPFWQAIMSFDANKDGKLERKEMTGNFTYPLRPELPPGHAGFGIPLPRDKKHRKSRLDGIFGWVDRNRDGYWTNEEYTAHMAFRRGKPLLAAIRPGGTGNIEESHVTWELNRSIPEIPSPLFHEDLIYLVRNGGLLAAVDAKEGDQLYRERLGGSGQYSASPVAANGHLYLISNLGLLSVVKTGRKFNLIHSYDLKEPVLVTPAIDATTLYIRSEKNLVALRSKNK